VHFFNNIDDKETGHAFSKNQTACKINITNNSLIVILMFSFSVKTNVPSKNNFTFKQWFMACIGFGDF
jgi:hypothetical protein